MSGGARPPPDATPSPARTMFNYLVGDSSTHQAGGEVDSLARLSDHLGLPFLALARADAALARVDPALFNGGHHA